MVAVIPGERETTRILGEFVCEGWDTSSQPVKAMGIPHKTDHASAEKFGKSRYRTGR